MKYIKLKNTSFKLKNESIVLGQSLKSINILKLRKKEFMTA